MKIVCIVQARMGSERLPGKVMKKILKIPMITYTLDRVKKSKYIDEVVLATSTKLEEENMVSYLIDNGYQVFRGSEHNVLQRYIKCIEETKADIVIRVTGDCPLIDPTLLDHVITYYLSHCYDYVSLDIPDTYFRGLDTEVFSRKSLERVYEITKEKEEHSPFKEHVTLYMYQHPKEFSICRLKADSFYQKPYRLCVDTKEDFDLITHIYEHFQDKYISSKEVIQYLDENPDLVYMNSSIKQKQV